MSLTIAPPRLVRVAVTDAHEGPVYVPSEDALYFTSVPKAAAPGVPHVAIRRLDLASSEVSLLTSEPAAANGMALGADGRLVVCEQGTRTRPARLSRVDPSTGELEPIVERWHGLPFNSPNDVVERSDGSIWFTDPSYGHLQGFRPEPVVGDNVYRHDPASGETDVVANVFDKPNGIAFSPDESVLYVTDSGANQAPGSFDSRRPHHVMAFDVVEGRRLEGGRVFATVFPGFPDGLETDPEGRVYVSCAAGVQVYEPGGEHVGSIHLPGAVNFTFGGADGETLLITTDTAVWAWRETDR